MHRMDQYYKQDELIALTQALVRIPSHKLVEHREKAVAEYIAKFCLEQGLSAECIPVEGERPNVIVRMKGTGGGKTLLFNGHIDTVPPYNMSIEPFEAFVRDGAIWGRGTTDMKGGIASMLTAMIAIKRSGVPLKGDVIFAGVIGEEERSEGSEFLVKSGLRADGAIIGEPSDYEYAIGHRGLEWLEIVITGKAAHGGVPELGINAIEKAATLIERIKAEIYPKLKGRFHEHMGPSIMNFGVIAGGTQPSSVADSCSIKIDRRYIPGEDVASVLKEYTDILDDMSAKDPDFHAELIRIPDNMLTLDHVYLQTDPSDPIAVAVRESLQDVLGKEPLITRKRGWTDAALLSHYAGIPTVVYGPGRLGDSHTKDESVEIKQLVDAVEVYGNVMRRFCMTSADK